MRFSPDSDCFAIAQRNDWLNIYDAYSGLILIHNLAFISTSNTSPIVWLCNSMHIFTLNSNQIRLFRNDKITTEWKIPGHSDNKNWSSCISLSNNKNFIAAFTGHILTFWNFSTCKQLGPVFEHWQVDRLYSIALLPDNNHVATGGNDRIIILCNLNDIFPYSLYSQSKVAQREVGTPVEAHQVTPCALELHSGVFYFSPICIPLMANSHQTS